MRRSLAPSQIKKFIDETQNGDKTCTATSNGQRGTRGGDGKTDITITTLPMFGFLEIPENLNKQFKIPSGCVITDE